MNRTGFPNEGVDLEAQPEDLGMFTFLSYSKSLKFDTNLKKLEVIALVRLHKMPKTQGPPEVPSQKGRQKEKARLSRQLIHGRNTRRRGPPTPVSVISYTHDTRTF